MNEKFIKQFIVSAKKLAENEPEYKAEIFTAVLTAQLIRQNDYNASPELSLTSDAGSLARKKISIREFSMEKQPRSDVERTATYAYFMEVYEGKKAFTSKDLVDCFRKSKEPVPENPADKISKCVAKGWLTKGEMKGTHSITNTGIKAVENGFKEE